MTFHISILVNIPAFPAPDKWISVRFKTFTGITYKNEIGELLESNHIPDVRSLS